MKRKKKHRPAKKRTLDASLAALEKAIRSCDSAHRSRKLDVILRHLRSAKKSYGRALRTAWKLALSEEDVGALELRSVLLEQAIAHVEEWYKIVACREDALGAEDRRRPNP